MTKTFLPEAVASSGTTPVRIFVVEDEALIWMELADRLTSLGYEPCGHATRGEVALTQIPEKQPDLVLMDIHLAGELSGVDVAEKLGDQLDVPVIFLTAYSDDELVRRAAHTKPYAYLVKPFDERELRANIETALHHHFLEKQLRDSRALLGQRNRELEALNDELQQALAKVRELRGIIPICLSCKKVRDDHEYWQTVETYVETHTDAHFSHGYCPECYAEYRKQHGL